MRRFFRRIKRQRHITPQPSQRRGVRRWGWFFVFVFVLAVVSSTVTLCKRQPEIGWEFAYDGAGHITEVVAPGRKTQLNWEFDKQERLKTLTQKLADGSRITLQYDSFGRPSKMEDAIAGVNYEYDTFNRLTAVRRKDYPPKIGRAHV